MKKIALVTVNYNTARDTFTLLNSLERLKTDDLELDVIVVDNGSKSPITIEKKYKHKISLIRSEVNAGFSGGYNLGISQAFKNYPDYVLIINNDTIVDSDMLINLVKVIESNPKIGAVTPKIYFAKGHEFHKDRYKENELGRVFWYAGGFMDWKNIQSIHRGVDEVDRGQYDKIEKIDFASGCCLLFRREVLEKVGLLDDKYFLYYEDADLNQRIKKAGYEIFYVPKAVLIHVNAASSGGAGNALQDYFITRNQMLFGMKYAPIRSKLALLRQSLRILLSGRPNQKMAIRDFYFGKFNKGSFFDSKIKQ